MRSAREDARTIRTGGARIAIVSHEDGRGTLASWNCVWRHWGDLNSSLADQQDLVLLDLTRTTRPPDIPKDMAKRCIAILSESATAEEVVRAGKTYADFCVGWPSPIDLLHLLTKLPTRQSGECSKELLFAELSLQSLRGNSESFRQEIAKIPTLGRAVAPVMIAGETGTGKELCARAVHFASRRRGGPFIVVDCAALPDHLVENELFGHAQGAYTDARTSQKGLVALAERGSLFLDEIDSLSLVAQSKLLRFLEDRVYRPLGSDRFLKADVRLLAATNKPLEQLVKNGQFRSDLFYRLNVLVLHLPPLRDRIEDIGLLARHFITEAAGEFEVAPPTLSESLLQELESYDWPGNVRELRNVIRRAVALCDGSALNLPDGQALLKHQSPVTPPVDITQFKHARQGVIDAFEKTFVQQLLDKHCGNITRAAMEVGKERRAFGRLVKKHGLASGQSGSPRTQPGSRLTR